MVDTQYLENRVAEQFGTDVDLDYDSEHYAEPGDTVTIGCGSPEGPHYRVTVQLRYDVVHLSYTAGDPTGGTAHREFAPRRWYNLAQLLGQTAVELRALGVLDDRR